MAVDFGSDTANVAISVTASTLEEVEKEWAQVSALGPDLIEWRLDCLSPAERGALKTIDELGSALRATHAIPVLATVRTTAEGGEFSGSTQQYQELLETAAKWADWVDVEISHPGGARLIHKLSARVAVVGSFHDFSAVPSAGQTQQLLAHMHELGCAVAKVAWMVQSLRDLEVILEMQLWAVRNLPIPAVVIGMGPIGRPSRLGWAARRSAFTFARGVRASAPGQPSVEEVRTSAAGV